MKPSMLSLSKTINLVLSIKVVGVMTDYRLGILYNVDTDKKFLLGSAGEIVSDANTCWRLFSSVSINISI